MTDEAVQLDVLATPELAVPPTPPQAHRGQIVGVTLETFDSGSTAMVFGLLSLDTGREDSYRLFVPRMFVEDIAVDPASLPEEKGNNQRGQYRIGISNGDQTATLQQLRAIARAAGRTLPAETAKPTNITEFVELHNQLLSGVEMVYTLAPEADAEPQFKHVLKVNGFRNPAEVIGNPKMLKRYAKMWEQQA